MDTDSFKDEDIAGTHHILAASEGAQFGAGTNGDEDEPPAAEKLAKILSALVRHASTSSDSEGQPETIGHAKEPSVISVCQAGTEQPTIVSSPVTQNGGPLSPNLTGTSPLPVHEELCLRIREKLKPHVNIKVHSGQR